MMRFPKTALICLCLLAGVVPMSAVGAPREELKTGKDAYERYLSMMGGRPALETIRSVRVEGTLVQGKFKAPFELKARRTGAFVLRIVTGDGKFRRIGCDSMGRGWQEQDGAFYGLTETSLEEHRLMLIPFLPLSEFRGKQLLEGKSCRLMKEGGKPMLMVGEGSGKTIPKMLFEPGTCRLRRLGKYTFKDFRFTEGVFAPYWIRDGSSVYHVHSVQFVQPMSDAEFAFPKNMPLLPPLPRK